MPGAVTRTRPRQHGGHQDLVPQSIELRLLRGPQVSQLSDQVPGLGDVGVHVLQGQDPKLAFGEARILGEASASLGTPVNGVRVCSRLYDALNRRHSTWSATRR